MRYKTSDEKVDLPMATPFALPTSKPCTSQKQATWVMTARGSSLPVFAVFAAATTGLAMCSLQTLLSSYLQLTQDLHQLICSRWRGLKAVEASEGPRTKAGQHEVLKLQRYHFPQLLFAALALGFGFMFASLDASKALAKHPNYCSTGNSQTFPSGPPATAIAPAKMQKFCFTGNSQNFPPGPAAPAIAPAAAIAPAKMQKFWFTGNSQNFPLVLQHQP